MTGFGRCEITEQGLTAQAQASSVNRKNLEIIASLPKELQNLERQLSEMARKVASRGRIQFSIEARLEPAISGGLPSDAQFDAALARLKSVAARHGARFELDAGVLAQVARLIEVETQVARLPVDLAESLVLRAAEAALDQLVAMRAQEGGALKEDLAARGETLGRLVSQVRQYAPEMVARYRENLLARLEQGGLALDPSDERVLREIALFADRCDVSEEITRLESHLIQFGQLLERDEPVGRPLEFLLQEIGREINTTGSKASTLDVSRLVLEMKNELERIREQVANVE